MTWSMMAVASSVALTGDFPVDVLMKSAPWPTAMRAALSMKWGSPSSPVSRITLRRCPSVGTALRTASSTIVTCSIAPCR